MDKKRLGRQAVIIKALAHPSRLCIVQELQNGERCVRDCRELIGADMSTVSRHLAILRNAGIVRDEKRGNQVYYSLTCDCVAHFVRCIETIMDKSAQEQLSQCGI
jgi:DNA-binding transcriptional ArsR family regulator